MTLPNHVRDRLLTHITNPDEFWGEYVLPTVARNDTNYDPKTMWRGLVWANINSFFIEALRQVGEYGLVRRLWDKTLELTMSQPDIYEYYDSQTGQPPATAAETFGWTVAVFIDLVIRASREEDVE